MKSSFLLLIVLTSFNVLSQNVTYDLSEPFPTIDARDKFYFSRGDDLMTVKVNPGFVSIQKWDTETMNQTSSKRYDKIIPGFRFEGVRELLGRYYIFYSAFEKATVSERLFVRELDFDSGELIGKEKLVLKVDGKVNGPSGGIPIGLDIKKFNIQVSPNEVLFLVQYRKAGAKRMHDLGSIELCVFDSENFEKVWEREVESSAYEWIGIHKYLIGDDGKVFLCGTRESEHGEFYNVNDLVYTYVVLIINQDLELTEVALNINENIDIYKIKSFIQKSGEIIFSGNYKENNDDSKRGLVFAMLGENFEFSPLRKIKFTDEVMTVLKKSKKKGDAPTEEIDDELSSFEVRHLKLNQNGSGMIIAEKEVRLSESYQGNKEILVAKFGNNDEVIWMKKLSKSQSNPNSSPYVVEDVKYFQYYDFEKLHYFLFRDKDRMMKLYKVDDETGEVEKIELLNEESINDMRISQFGIERAAVISNQTIVMGAYSGKKKDILIKVKL